jgi:uncharacterized protein (TIRG00374 family)
VALIVYCLWIVEIDPLLKSISELDMTLFVLAFVINFLGTIICKAALVWYLVSQDRNISFFRVISINLILRFYTIILPRAAVAALRWYKYKSLTSAKDSLVLLTVDALSTLMFLAVGASFFIQFDTANMASMLVRWSVYLISFGLLATLLLFFVFPENCLILAIHRWVNKISRLSRLSRLMAVWSEMANKFQFAKKRNLLVVFGSSGLSYFLFLLSSYLLMLALGMGLSFVIVAWVRSVVLLMAHLPISIAGLGVRELGFVAFLGLYGVSPESALAYALVSFGLQLGLAMMGAVLELYQSVFVRVESLER